MNIWKQLQIEPTTDQKAIRRAYAARSRMIHPEERPEEFRMLYEAYQEALSYAKRGGQSASFVAQKTEEETVSEKKEEKSTDTEETAEEALLLYLQKQLRQREQYVQEFVQHWIPFAREQRTPKLREWWRQYLFSEDFQNIKWHPRVVKLLVEELEKRFIYEKDFKILLWEAYDFPQKEEEYKGDLQKLYQILYTEYELKNIIEGLHMQQEQNKKVWKRCFMVAGILLLLFAPFWLYSRLTAEQRFVVSYMNKTYPGIAFSDPEKGEQTKEGREYHFRTPLHPEFEIKVQVSKEKKDGYYASDNYCAELLNYYAQMYELPCGVEKNVLTLYYKKTEDLSAFCQKVMQMFQEQEELTVLKEVGVCAEGLIYPEVMIEGGVYGFSYPEKQVYQVEELMGGRKAEELSRRMFEGYLFYLFNYEAWNLTDEQYQSWGPRYEQLCREASFDGGEWCNLYQGDQKVCDLFLPIYRVPEYNDIGGFQQTTYTRMITVGNAYHYLRMQKAAITVNEDGSGFCVEHDGKIDIYGQGAGAAIKFYLLDSES